MKRFVAATLLFLALCSTGGLALEAIPGITDEQVDIRMEFISGELRCLVCRNEALADSGAELAKDLRREIRNQIKAGKSDREVLDFIVGRYGDFVVYQPTLKVTTLLLWLAPAIPLFVGSGALVRYLRRRSKPMQEMID